MCGRYSLALRPSQIRRMLQDDDMPVYDAPEDPADDDEDAGGGGGGGGYDRPRQSYNFAPGYRGVVYRADVPDRGAGPKKSGEKPASSSQATDEGDTETTAENADEGDDGNGDGDGDVRYKMQAMKWGLIPFWTKRNPDYGSMMKTINCRDDSLAQGGGMWASMKARKRCVVVAQGFYEWLKKDGGREKMPHFVKRKDGKLMCMAGLWDMVQYEGDEQKHYTYTIITTDSNKQLNFLHDRMPVILDNGSDKMRTWLDPGRFEWSDELQSLLKPYDGELEVYPVSKDVGKVGNNSATFVIPIDSKENKNNIANFFAKGSSKIKSISDSNSTNVGVGGKNQARGHGSETPSKVTKVERQPEIEVDEKEGFKVPKSEDGDEDEDEHDSKVKIKSEDAVKDEEEEEEDIKSTTVATAAGVKREADTDIPDAKPPPQKRLHHHHQQHPSTATTTTSTASSSPVKTTTTTTKPPPSKGSSSGSGSGSGSGRLKKKISATSNGTKAPDPKSKAAGAGTQKITKFFGNSS